MQTQLPLLSPPTTSSPAAAAPLRIDNAQTAMGRSSDGKATVTSFAEVFSANPTSHDKTAARARPDGVPSKPEGTADQPQAKTGADGDPPKTDLSAKKGAAPSPDVPVKGDALSQKGNPDVLPEVPVQQKTDPRPATQDIAVGKDTARPIVVEPLRKSDAPQLPIAGSSDRRDLPKPAKSNNQDTALELPLATSRPKQQSFDPWQTAVLPKLPSIPISTTAPPLRSAVIVPGQTDEQPPVLIDDQPGAPPPDQAGRRTKTEFFAPLLGSADTPPVALSSPSGDVHPPKSGAPENSAAAAGQIAYRNTYAPTSLPEQARSAAAQTIEPVPTPVKAAVPSPEAAQLAGRAAGPTTPAADAAPSPLKAAVQQADVTPLPTGDAAPQARQSAPIEGGQIVPNQLQGKAFQPSGQPVNAFVVDGKTQPTAPVPTASQTTQQVQTATPGQAAQVGANTIPGTTAQVTDLRPTQPAVRPAQADGQSARTSQSSEPSANAPASVATPMRLTTETPIAAQLTQQAPAERDRITARTTAQSFAPLANPPAAETPAAVSPTAQPRPETQPEVTRNIQPSPTVAAVQMAPLAETARRTSSASDRATMAADRRDGQVTATPPQQGTILRPQTTQPPLVQWSAPAAISAELGSGKEILSVDPIIGETRPGASTTSLTAVPGATRPDLPANIARQLAEVVQQMPNRPVEITLKPQELGSVRLTVQHAEAGIVVHLTAERPETLDLMRRHIDQLGQDFQALGYSNISFSFGGEDQGSNTDAESEKGGSSSSSRTGNETIADTPTEIHLAAGPAGGVDLRV